MCERDGEGDIGANQKRNKGKERQEHGKEKEIGAGQKLCTS